MGKVPARDEFFSPKVSQSVLHYAIWLRNTGKFESESLEELQQSLSLELIKQCEAYDPDRGMFVTFADRVLRNVARMMLRARKRIKRGFNRPAISLDQPRRDKRGPETSRRDSLTTHDQARRLCLVPRELHQQQAEALHLNDALQLLSPELRLVAVALMEKSETEVARELGVSRTSMRQLTHQLRDHLEECGFDGSF